MLDNEARFLLQQLHGERVCDNHEHHWHIERKQRAKDEEHSVVDSALLRLRHDVLDVDDSCKSTPISIRSTCVESFKYLPRTVMDDDINIASIHTRKILKLVRRFVEL